MKSLLLSFEIAIIDADYDGLDKDQGYNYSVFTLGSAILSIVMFNIIVAILMDTFYRVFNQKSVVSSQAKVE